MTVNMAKGGNGKETTDWVRGWGYLKIMIFKSAPGWAEESEVRARLTAFGGRYYLLFASITLLAISSSNILKQLIYKLRS